MKVLKRSQITEVITNRIVSHVLEVNGKKYIRYQKQKTVMPYMDCKGSVSEPTIEWNVYTGQNIIATLTKKEVKELQLNELFNALPIDERNGNA